MEDAYQWLGYFLALLIMGGLLGAWYFVNRDKMDFGKLLKSADRDIQVVDYRWLSARTTLFLVEVEGERFLLAQSATDLAWQPLKKKDRKIPEEEVK